MQKLYWNLGTNMHTFNFTCLSRPYPFKFFKSSLPQILLGPFLNTWAHILWGGGDLCASANLRTPK